MSSYVPISQVLVVTICSFNKVRGGEPSFDATQSVTADLPADIREQLFHVRKRVLNIVKKSNEISWGGVPLSKLEFNAELVDGSDFGGTGAAAYLPALDRYDGRFSQTLGPEGKRRLCGSRHHVLFLSGLYGVVRPFESIQLYSCPLSAAIADEWRKSDVLTSVLISYARLHHITRVLDLTAVNAYRDLVDWQALTQFMGVQVLHAFDAMGMGDNALVPFARLMKDQLLDASEQELMAITSDERRGTVTFRSLANAPPGLPAEKSLDLAERELPLLETYPIGALHEVIQGGNPPPAEQDTQGETWKGCWPFIIASVFRKQVAGHAMRGRIMNAILEISRDPMREIGDTQKPLLGKLMGKWRRRIGDYRLIYEPIPDKGVVHLLDFGARGNIYDD